MSKVKISFEGDDQQLVVQVREWMQEALGNEFPDMDFEDSDGNAVTFDDSQFTGGKLIIEFNEPEEEDEDAY